jgi:4-hydroxymandelate oxidase
MTRVLAGVSDKNVNTKLSVFGEQWDSPIMIAPTAFHKLCVDEGELSTARAAAASGVCYVYPFMLSNTICDDVASAAGPKWAHLYILKVIDITAVVTAFSLHLFTQDREYVLHIIKEAERLGFTAIVVTCDHPHDGVKRNTLPAFNAHANDPIRGVPLKQRMRFPNADR